MKRFLFAAFSAVISICMSGQNAREEIAAEPAKAAGLYYAYPGPQSTQTAPPKGFKPFYISHLGRHGSRWLTYAGIYSDSVGILKDAEEAGALTDFGKDILKRLEIVAADAEGHVEELTPLGVRQHKEIAARMSDAFPRVFRKGAVVTANSTQSTRVMISMFSFCDKLHELNPKLDIDVNASVRDEDFVANRTDESRAVGNSDEWYQRYEAFRAAHLHPGRVISSLFSDQDYVRASVDTNMLYEYLFEIRSIVQNCPVDVSFEDLFTNEELFDFWQVRNYEYYTSKGPDPKGGEALTQSALPMLEHFIDKADDYLAGGLHGATLRFSHDSYLVPLAVCMQLDGCRGKETDPDQYYAAFTNYKISPMGGNIQWIFFKNRKGEVIVKFLLNENEVGIPAHTDLYPYYRWEDVKAYYGNCYKICGYGYDKSLEAAAGLLKPYPEPQGVKYSAAPKGYKPFYISHFGRHGSRWHTQWRTYSYPYDILQQAALDGKLTYKGQEVLRRVAVLKEDADRRTGELTPLGFRQHAGIAQRMYSNYPEVFKGRKHVTAHSTGSPRVLLSMNSFCETLKGLNPDLDIRMDTGNAFKSQLNGLSEESGKYKKNAMWKSALSAFEDEMYRPQRLMGSLFNDDAYVTGNVDARRLMDCLYELSGIALDTELDIRLYDIFEPQEIIDIWKTKNYSYYMQKGPNSAAGDTVVNSAKTIVKDFIVQADKAVAGDPDADAATLRFSHDSYLTPLTTTLRLGGCREATDDPMKAAEIWSTSEVSPMAGNVQMILYRNRKNDVIVKFLHNEREVDVPIDTDIYPYYRWDDVRAFYDKTLDLGL